MRGCRVWVNILFLCAALHVAVPAKANETAPPELTNYFQELWTTRDGLPHNTINSVTQTEEGYIWLATWEGLTRYNGAEFKNFDLYSNIGLRDAGLQNVRVAESGQLIVVGARGTVVLREQGAAGTTEWRTLETPLTLVNKAIYNQDNSYWLATEELGLLKYYSPDNVESFFDQVAPNNNVMHAYDIAKPDDSQLYVATNLGLVRVTKDDLYFINSDYGLPKLGVFSVTQYGDDFIVGTEQGAFIGRQETGFKLIHPKLDNVSVIRVMIDDIGDIWLGSIDKGLFRLSKAHGLENLSMADGLPNSRVLAIYQDAERSIWIGTNGGLMRLRNTPFRTYTAKDGLADNFVRTVIQRENGDIWVGSAGGVSVYSNNKWSNLDLGLQASVLSLHEHPELGIFIGTYTDGLLLWNNGQVIQHWTRNDGLLANEIRSITTTHTGRVWFATPNGINFYEPGKGIGEPNQQVDHAQFSVSLHEDKNQQLWLGTARGLFKFEAGHFVSVDISKFNHAQYVFNIQSVGDELWLATDRGLIIYQPEQQQGIVIGRPQGLIVEKVFQFTIDENNNVWLTSNRGIMRTTVDDIRAVQTQQSSGLTTVEVFRESDGLVSSQANGGSNPAILHATDDTIWVPTANGIARIAPNQLAQFTDYPPPAVIENVELNGQFVKPSSAQTRFDGERISISYAGLGFTINNQIRYRTQLLGYDDNWRTTSARYAEFTNLPPGDYTFRVQAAYSNSDQIGRTAEFSFSVPPRYYQQLWFWIIASVALLVAILTFVRVRLNVMARRAAELEQQVAEKTEALRTQAERFEHLAQFDELTNLPNRRSFNRDLSAEFAAATRHKKPLTLAIIDVDNFKRINDNFSHSSGDIVLQWLADLLKQHTRQEDKIARWGGEEFTILMTDTTIDTAEIMCNRLREHIMQTPPPAQVPIEQLTVSIGLSSLASVDSIDSLLSHADRALYTAKSNGRNRVCRYPTPN
ncbi:diguanylate cyclase [Pseudidiomarina donghaiensis]|uniref:ligand-binding sensor domain-containing diguanylate cyclase n=1 Tax=Pseudidiomarina donghaiensis TaxID=519452 RepID=UPI003A97634C